MRVRCWLGLHHCLVERVGSAKRSPFFNHPLLSLSLSLCFPTHPFFCLLIDARGGEERDSGGSWGNRSAFISRDDFCTFLFPKKKKKKHKAGKKNYFFWACIMTQVESLRHKKSSRGRKIVFLPFSDGENIFEFFFLFRRKKRRSFFPPSFFLPPHLTINLHKTTPITY